MEPWNDVMRSLGRIEERLDKLDNLADRVAALERWQYRIHGGWAALVAAGTFIAWITRH